MKTLTMLILMAGLSVQSFAAQFAPTLLKLSAPQIVGYDFDGSRLEIPVAVSGTTAGLIFCVYTRDQADIIPYTVNGYLGWHMVNKIDTCIYYSPLKSVNVGENTVSWDGRTQDGAFAPTGEYTYYIWAFDNQGSKQLMSKFLQSGWGFDYMAAVQERDENGLPLANPLWYTADSRWYIGNDPLDETLKETCAIMLAEDWGRSGEPLIDPRDFTSQYCAVKNLDTNVASIQKYRWVPNGEAEIQQYWGEENGFATPYAIVGGTQAGVTTDGNYMFAIDENHVSSTDPDAQFYIYDFDGYLVDEVDLTPWWSSAADFKVGGQMNGGPNSFFARDGNVFLNCHCNCLNQMVNPARYLETGEYENFFVWSNGNGDYVLDHNFEETATLRWICNDYNVGPYKYSISADANLFSACNAYDVGAVSFGLLAPDGTGLGYFAFAGETAGWKKGTIFIDANTPFDGIYCDNEQTAGPHYDYDSSKKQEGIYFIGHDSVKGIITIDGWRPDITPFVTVIAPNGGEVLERGKTAVIRWVFRGAETLAIEQSSDNGQTWTIVEPSVKASAGSYTWTVSGGVSDACRIRIRSTSDASISDMSDRAFRIMRSDTGPYYESDIANTGSSATLIIPADHVPNLFGEPIEAGDCIGIFTPRGTCAGAVVWEGVNAAVTIWGDNEMLDGVKGFLPGEKMTFKVHDGSKSRDYVVMPTFSLGSSVFTPDGIYVLSSLETTAMYFTLDLDAGWNTVSLPIALSEYSISSILGPAYDSLQLLKNGRGDICWPAYGINAVGQWKLHDGYQLYMKQGASVSLHGYEVFSPDEVFNCPAGWNLIGYFGEDGLPLTTAYESILDRVLVAKNGDGNVFWPEYSINQITGMHRGEGYWLYLSAPVSFSYPSIPVTTAKTAGTPTMPVHFPLPEKTGGNATILLTLDTVAASNTVHLSAGDEIAAFTSSGICMGAGVWRDGANCAFPVWGDDPMTDGVDGFTNGEAVLLVVWNSETGEEYALSALTSSGELRYSQNGLLIVNAIGGTGAGIENNAPAAFTLAQNTPNPFNPSTTIRFSLAGEARVTLDVFAVSGAKIATLAEGSMSAGEHEVVWDASGFPSGVYFCRLRAGANEKTMKMMLVK